MLCESEAVRLLDSLSKGRQEDPIIDLNKLTLAARAAFVAAIPGSNLDSPSEGGPFQQVIGAIQSVLEGVSKEAVSCYGLVVKAQRRWVVFDPFAVDNFYDADEIALLESYVGDRVYPFAVLSLSHAFLTSTGRVIVLDRDWLFYCVLRDLYAFLNWLFAEDDSFLSEHRELSPAERPEGLG